MEVRVFLLSALHFMFLLPLILDKLLHPLEHRERLDFLSFCCPVRVGEEAVALFDALVNVFKQARALRIAFVALDVLPLVA